MHGNDSLKGDRGWSSQRQWNWSRDLQETPGFHENVSSIFSLQNPSTNPETPSLRNLYNLYSERRRKKNMTWPRHIYGCLLVQIWNHLKIVDYSNGSLTGKHVGGIKTCNLPLMMFDLSIRNSNANSGQMSTGWCTSKCTKNLYVKKCNASQQNDLKNPPASAQEFPLPLGRSVDQGAERRLCEASSPALATSTFRLPWEQAVVFRLLHHWFPANDQWFEADNLESPNGFRNPYAIIYIYMYIFS